MSLPFKIRSKIYLIVKNSIVTNFMHLPIKLSQTAKLLSYVFVKWPVKITAGALNIMAGLSRFSSGPPGKFRDNASNTSCPFLSISIPMQCSLISLPLDVIVFQLFAASLNKS
jgi:hypothetical protein